MKQMSKKRTIVKLMDNTGKEVVELDDATQMIVAEIGIDNKVKERHVILDKVM